MLADGEEIHYPCNTSLGVPSPRFFFFFFFLGLQTYMSLLHSVNGVPPTGTLDQMAGGSVGGHKNF